jgi:hypothetical protein
MHVKGGIPPSPGDILRMYYDLSTGKSTVIKTCFLEVLILVEISSAIVQSEIPTMEARTSV